MRVLFITTSRSDYGILEPLLRKIKKDKFFQTKILVTGEHNSKIHNKSKNLVLKDNKLNTNILKISDREGSNPKDILKKSSIILSKIFHYLKNINPDIILLVGDRYETFLVSYASMVCRIPIAHLHGGEKTVASIDDAMRHSISKMANIHLVERLDYKRRLIQIGEDRSKIFVVGSLGRENINNTKLFSKKYLEKNLKFKFFDKNIIFTYHPETLNTDKIEKNIKIILKSIKNYNNIRFIFTSPNLDVGSNIIRKNIMKFIKNNSNAVYFPSLGSKKYFSVLKYSDGVIGNSSSAIIEVPFMKKFSINIGNRQKGRFKYPSVINIKNSSKEIKNAINLVYQKKFSIKIKKNKIYSRKTSNKIVGILKKINLNKILFKEFVDL